MAGSNPIKGKQIYESDGALEKLEQDLTKLDASLLNLEGSAKKVHNTLAKLKPVSNDQKETIKENVTQADKLSREHKKLKESYTSTSVEIKKIQEIRKKQNQLTKLEIQLAKSSEGSYNKLSAQYSILKIKLNGMSKAQREGTVSGRAMVKQSKELFTEMNRLQKVTGKNQLNVGNYAAGAKQAAGALLGFATGVGATIVLINKLKQGISTAIKTWTDYSKQTSKVQAISGATASELKILSGQAEFLGETTEKTASQVSQLQLELAKLGFDPKQIEDATSSILDLSTAIDSDLAQSAIVVGQVLRAYNLDASETQRVTDVMASSFSKSSLDLSKFQTAMSTVAPVAKTFGFDLEDTTALLAQLTDAGFDASRAGTALRNILLNLADGNGDLAQALGGSVTNASELLDGLDHLNTQGVDLNKTLQLTDKRSVAAFNRFLGATDKTRKLTKELKNASGEAERMAKVMRDNLQGDIDKARSATQGLFINLGKRLNPALRESVQEVTKFVGKLNEYIALKPSEEMRNEQIQLNVLVGAISNVNNTQESRNRLLSELQRKYPDFLDNLDTETVTNEELRDRLKEVNAEYREKILQLTKQELIQKRQNELVKLQTKEIEIIKEITKLEIALEGVTNRANQKRREQFQMLDTYNKNLVKNRKNQEDLNKELEEEIAILNGLIDVEKDSTETTEEGGDKTKEVTDIVDDYSNTLKALKENLSELKKEKDLINLSDEKGIINKQKEINELQKLIDIYEELGKVIKVDTGAFDEISIGGTVSMDSDAGIFEELNKLRLNEITDTHKALEDLEKSHSDNMIGLLMKNVSKRNAIKDQMNAEEIQKEIEKNETIAEGMTTATEFAIDQISQLFDHQVEVAEEELRLSERKVDLSWNALDAEIRARELGFANNVATQQKEFEAAKKQQAKANKEKQKAVKQQQTLDSITQASSLITATANIWSSMSSIPIVGSLLAIAATALMWGSFAYAKVKASQVTSFKEGGTFNVGGGTHASGNDTSLGVHGGREMKVEKNEKVGIFNAMAVKRYGSGNLDSLLKDINSGVLSANLDKSIIGENDMPHHLLFNANYDTVDLRNLETNVRAIKQQGDEREFTDSKGRRVKVYKNLKRTYID